MPKSNDKSQTFSCMNCGSPYVVYPPQTGYNNAMLEPCPKGCNKPMNVICRNCSKTTTIYWCSGHITVVGGRF